MAGLPAAARRAGRRRGDHGVEPYPAQPLRRQHLPAGLVRPADDLDLQQGRLRQGRARCRHSAQDLGRAARGLREAQGQGRRTDRRRHPGRLLGRMVLRPRAGAEYRQRRRGHRPVHRRPRLPGPQIPRALGAAGGAEEAGSPPHPPPPAAWSRHLSPPPLHRGHPACGQAGGRGAVKIAFDLRNEKHRAITDDRPAPRLRLEVDRDRRPSSTTARGSSSSASPSGTRVIYPPRPLPPSTTPTPPSAMPC